MDTVTSIEALEALYGSPKAASILKEIDYISADYSRFIEASPFVALATSGPKGLDCSPRGDLPGFVRVADKRTLMMPDRMGNNRIDSLRNIIVDARVSLMFLIPGSGTVLRVIGRAEISVDPDLCTSFAVKTRAPRSVIVIGVDAVYFQCARSIVRSDLWNQDKHIDPKSLPSPGDILGAMSDGRLGGESYDSEWPKRAKETMW